MVGGWRLEINSLFFSRTHDKLEFHSIPFHSNPIHSNPFHVLPNAEKDCEFIVIYQHFLTFQKNEGNQSISSKSTEIVEDLGIY